MPDPKTGRYVDTDRMPFGLHKGKYLYDISDAYWRWFLKQDWSKRWPKLVEYAKVAEGEDFDDV